MSEIIKKSVKKPRINQVETLEVPVKEQIKATETPTIVTGTETTGNVDFDWELYEHSGNSKLKVNKSVKTNGKDKVYSFDKGAQEFYDLLNSSTSHSYQEPVKGGIYEGTVTSINENDALIDIGYREEVYIKLNKEKEENINLLEPGGTISIKVINDKEDSNAIMGSMSGAIEFMKEQELKECIETQSTAYAGEVLELIESGGYIVKVNDIKCFMPGSLAGMNKLYDFKSILGKTLYVVPINYSKEKGTIVVSHRKYLQTLIPTRIEEVKEEISGLYNGFVTGTTKFGVFCEFSECLTGMIHASDLNSEFKALHSDNSIKPGDEVEFYIKEIVNEKKIILTQNPSSDPWRNIDKKYKVPSVVQGRINAVKDYGAFIELEKGIVGLLHCSEYKDRNIVEGETTDIRINKIDKSTKKIFLALAD